MCSIADNLYIYVNEIDFRQANQLTMSDRKTLLSLYELICHLVHLSEHQYLKQFCDAVEFLGASELLANLMVIGKRSRK